MTERKLREAVKAAADAMDRRDAAIREASKTMSQRTIASITGLSQSRVQQIASKSR